MAEWDKKLIDMELNDESKLDAVMPIAMQMRPDYPYGLQITLCDEQLEKLGLGDDCEKDDAVRFEAYAVVTNVSRNDGTMGKSCRVELQIRKMKVLETDEKE